MFLLTANAQSFRVLKISLHPSEQYWQDEREINFTLKIERTKNSEKIKKRKVVYQIANSKVKTHHTNR